MKRTACILIFLLLSVVTLHAQWTALSGPYGCLASGFYSEDSILYTATSISFASEIYRSFDNGHHWEALHLGLPDDIYNLRILYKRDSLYCIELQRSDSNGKLLYLSRDNGKTFISLLDSASDYSVVNLADTLLIARNTFLATGDNRGLIQSTDGGLTWSDISPVGGYSFSNLQILGTTLFALRSRSAFENDWQISVSTNSGKSWDSLAGDSRIDFLTNISHPVAFSPYSYNGDTILWVAVDVAPSLSTNKYVIVWNISLPSDSIKIARFPTKYSNLSADTTINTFLLNDGKLFASTSDQIYEFDPSQSQWNVLTDKIPRYSVDKITNFYPTPQKAKSEFLITINEWSRWHSGYTGGIYRFDSAAAFCIPSDTGMTSTETAQIYSAAGILYSLTAASGYPLYTSVDHGTTWTVVELPPNIHGYDILSLITTSKGLVYSNRDSIFLKSGDSVFINAIIGEVLDFTKIGPALYAWANFFYRSDDSGKTWKKLTKPPLLTMLGSAANTAFKNLMLVGGDSIIISSDGCYTWQKVHNLPLAKFLCISLASDENNIYASGTYPEGSNTFYGVLRSSDSGKSWNSFISKQNFEFYKIMPFRDKIFFATRDGVYRCNSDGSELIPLFPSEKLRNCYAIETDSQYFYAGTLGYGIFRATLEDILNYRDGVSKPIQFDSISFSAYPNPAKHGLIIESPGNLSNASCTLFDQLGRSLLRRDRLDFTNGNKTTLDVSGLSSGTYFLRLESNGLSRSQPVVISH